MRTKGRRRLDRILLVLGAVVGGGIVAIGGAVGDAERIPQMWVGAELSAEGGTQVAEVIDYDFGLIPKHGIFRTIPGLALNSVVTVESATAPDDIAAFTPVFIDGEQGMEVKVGDPNTTITGRHRYLLDYELPRDVLVDAAGHARLGCHRHQVDRRHPARRGPHRGALGARGRRLQHRDLGQHGRL